MQSDSTTDDGTSNDGSTDGDEDGTTDDGSIDDSTTDGDEDSTTSDGAIGVEIVVDEYRIVEIDLLPRLKSRVCARTMYQHQQALRLDSQQHRGSEQTNHLEQLVTHLT